SWTAVLCASLMIPALNAVLPTVAIAVAGTTSPSATGSPKIHESSSSALGVSAGNAESESGASRLSESWPPVVAVIYGFVTLVLLLRLAVGLAISSRFLAKTSPTGRWAEGIEIRESDRVTGPMTLGFVRPAIVIPQDWSCWHSQKLESVLAHE